MAIKKSELYSSLWASCDKLRGGMDASQYKDYVLVLLFVKYVSDKYAGKKDALIEIPKGGSFQEMVKLKGRKDIGDGINKIIYKLAEENDLVGVITTADFNDEEKLGKGKEMQDKLSDLVAIFENPELDFSKNRADGDDILGDAYEYLMRHFATESGKSKGQFYTPAEVSRILAKVIGVSLSKRQDQTIYDPTCGSGSLLLKVADEAERNVTIYGQEKDVTTAALARMNMILHNNPTAEITKGQSTLSNPLFWDKDKKLKTFDFVVANPPFSSKNWSDGFDPGSDIYERFRGYGIPPAKNGDYAFLLHIIRSLKSKGKGAVILPHGVLFRGNAEAEIRKNIIEKGIIKGIIGLPSNLFYGTNIPACIIIVDKENAESRKGIFMIDASKGFVKDGNKNRLRDQDIHKIVDIFNKQTSIEKYSRMISFSEIKENDYNLNIPRYIDSQDSQDTQDIEAHLLGDIPNADIEQLQSYWTVYPSLKRKLFGSSTRKGYSKLKVEPKHIRTTIFSHDEFISYAKGVNNIFLNWKKRVTPSLKSIKISEKPKKVIHKLSEDLLNTFAGKKLVDNYDVYQHLMSYWNNTMQDDVYILVTDGWKAGNEIEGNEKKNWEGRLIPKQVIIKKYFPQDQKAIEELEAKRDSFSRRIEELEEEHANEDGLLCDALNEKGKVTKALAQKRIKELETPKAVSKMKLAAEPLVSYGAVDSESEPEEIDILKKYVDLVEKESEANRKVIVATNELEKKVIAKYRVLNESEIKTLIVEDKWMDILNRKVQDEMDAISHRLNQRIKELGERYENPLPKLIYETGNLTEKVNTHLKQMGFTWK